MYNSIKPGKIWLDESGKRIQAHGGAIYYENDTYFWYGENKEYTDGIVPVWTWGIRFYSSKDLYNWKDEGLVVPPELNNEDSPLHPTKRIDRPHIIFNDTSRKYVMWFKQSGESACFSILTASNLLGPYDMVKETFRPLNKRVGDFDLVKDPMTSKAYLYFDGDHEGMISIELSDDYFDVQGKGTFDFLGLHPPFTREAMSHFERNGKHYMLTSGMSGYLPNPSEVAVSDSWLGPFEVEGNPHKDDKSCSSFNSQISCIFKHPHKKDLYIALADRWVPDFEVTKELYETLVRAIGAHFNPDKFRRTEEDKELLKKSPRLETANTSIADYVWLPITFEGDKVVIEWMDEWRIEDYE